MIDIKDRKMAKGFLRRTLSLIPNFLRLLYGLMRDSRVPMAEKALLAGAIAYVLSPIDIIPDLLPFIGQFDDLYLIALVTLRLVAHTSDDVIRDHWRGDQDITSVIDKIISASTYVLPKRMRDVLIGKIQIMPRKNLSQK